MGKKKKLRRGERMEIKMKERAESMWIGKKLGKGMNGKRIKDGERETEKKGKERKGNKCNNLDVFPLRFPCYSIFLFSLLLLMHVCR